MILKKKILKLYKIIFRLVICLFIAIPNFSFAQTSTIRKTIGNTVEFITKNTSDFFTEKSTKEIIDNYSRLVIKNGFGEKARFNSSTIKLFLKETEELRGRNELIKVGNKISTFNPQNLNNIKGFIAEEIHHNELLKIGNVNNIRKNIKFKTSKFVRKKQQNLIKEYDNNNLYVHKEIEIDIIAEKNNSKFLIEVKNIDSNFNTVRFQKYLSQIVKLKAYANENGIKKVFWSNIGASKLTDLQVSIIEKYGVIVLQHGSISPVVNAKVNMNKAKRELLNI